MILTLAFQMKYVAVSVERMNMQNNYRNPHTCAKI